MGQHQAYKYMCTGSVRGRGGDRKTLEEMAQNFPKAMKTNNLWNQEAQQIPSETNVKKSNVDTS